MSAATANEGNFVGNAIKATAKGAKTVGEVIGYIPGLEGVDAGTKLLVATPVTMMGNVVNFDLRGAKVAGVVGVTETGIAAAKTAMPGSGAADWLAGKLSKDGLKPSDRLVAQVEEVYRNDGTPGEGPAKTPSVPGAKGNFYTA